MFLLSFGLVVCPVSVGLHLILACPPVWERALVHVIVILWVPSRLVALAEWVCICCGLGCVCVCVCVLCAGYVGSPSYIAPEVLKQAARYDLKADVYSFGVLVWSLTQYLFLTHVDVQRRTTQEHLTLMRPYGGAS